MQQTISSRVHFHARNLIFHLCSPVSLQLRLRPAVQIRWIPGYSYSYDVQPQPDGELLRRVMLILYSLAPADKVRWIDALHVKYTFEQLTPKEQQQLLQVLEEFYAKRYQTTRSKDSET